MNHKLRQVRLNKKITQQEISNRTGYTQGQVSCWENGKSISLETAIKLSTALNITLEELINGI